MSAQTNRRTSTSRGRTTTTQKAAQKKKTTTKSSTQKKKAKPVDKKTQLRQQAEAAAKARKLQQQKAAELNRNIRTNLDSVLILDNQIGRQKKSIDSLSHDINALTVQIDSLSANLERLQKELAEKKAKYAKALVYMQRHKSVQQKLMFIFSAKNFEQLIRRMRYLREYSTYQRVQGQIIKEKQAELRRVQNELLSAKTKLETSRIAMQEKQHQLETAKGSCQKKVTFLNQNLATVQQQIKEYQKKEAELNAQIDRIIQEEIAEAKRRAEAERKRREEEARRRAAAAERQAADKKSGGKSGKAAKKAAEQPSEAEIAWRKEEEADRKLSSSFTANKGRLPIPITGGYSIVGHYGRYSVAGLKNVTLDNKGIDIRGQQGAQARAVFDGVVSQVFQYAGRYIVMVRHGSYISVYSGLSAVSVGKGTPVKTCQALGAVGRNDEGNFVLHFQLRQESSRLNPESWIR